MRHLLAIGGLLALLFVAGPTHADEGRLRAGFGRADLTPEGPVPLGGYGARMGRSSMGVHDPIQARAAVLERDGRQVALVSVDLVGVTWDVREEVLARLEGRGVTELVLAATHTHAGPGALTPVPLWKPMMGTYRPALRKRTVAGIARAILDARKDLAPAIVRWGRRRTAGLQRNRATKGGAVDPHVGLLRLDAPDGTPRGMVVHFAAHPTVLGAKDLALSAGWPGALCKDLEARVPGTTALFLQGAVGDVAPVLPAPPPVAEDNYARMTRYGRLVAAEAAKLHAELANVAARPGTLSIETRFVHAQTAFARLFGTEGRVLDGATTRMPTTRLMLGALTLETIPGEPTQACRPSSATRWTVSCAQDHRGYFADRALFRRGGYEADMSFFGPGMAEAFARTWSPPARPPTVHGPPVRRTRRDPSRPVAVRSTLHDGVPLTRRIRIFGGMHGRLLGTEIRDLLGHAEEALIAQALEKGRPALTLLANLAGTSPEAMPIPLMVRAARRLQRHIPDAYLDEMEGIADGAGVPYDAILLENTFLTLAEQTNPAALLSLPVRCTNVVAFGEATSMGQLLHGSTLDWGMQDVLKDRVRVMVMEPPTGHPFVSVGWPGMVGTLRAMGAQGLAITEESCAAKDDTGMDGMPVNLLMRRVVQHTDDLDAAVAMLRETPGTCGYKITVSDGHRLDARVVEVTARHHHVRKPAGGLIFGCDPDADDSCFDGPCNPAIPRSDRSSDVRYPALRGALAQGRGTLRRSLLAFALGSPKGGVLNDGTLFACLFEPQSGRFHVATGDDVDPAAGELHWQSHELHPLLSRKARERYALPRAVTSAGQAEVREMAGSLGGVKRTEVFFDSPLPSGRAHNDRVRGELWAPAKGEPLGAVIHLPAWKERSLAGHRLLAAFLARKGIAVLLLPLPYQDTRAADGVRSGTWTLSANLARTRQALFQGLADVARASRWLEQRGFPPARQAVSGVSLGGHVAASAYGAYPDRFRAGVFILAGGQIHRGFMTRNRTTGRLFDRLKARGVTVPEALELMADLDPLTYADPERGERVLLIAATEDDVVPPESTKALAEAYGGARIVWLDGNHYAPARPKAMNRMIHSMGEHLTNVFEAVSSSDR